MKFQHYRYFVLSSLHNSTHTTHNSSHSTTSNVFINKTKLEPNNGRLICHTPCQNKNFSYSRSRWFAVIALAKIHKLTGKVTRRRMTDIDHQLSKWTQSGKYPPSIKNVRVVNQSTKVGAMIRSATWLHEVVPRVWQSLHHATRPWRSKSELSTSHHHVFETTRRSISTWNSWYKPKSEYNMGDM